MKNQFKQISNKLFIVIALAIVLTGSVFAQKSVEGENLRKQISESTRRVSRIENRTAAISKSVFSYANSLNFQVGKDFALAIYDAKDLDNSDEALNYTIVDMVYLIDDLENQSEAAQLQKLLQAAVRRTKSGAQISMEIETISKTYMARQKVDQKWYYNAGFGSMNLMISAYLGDNALTKKDVTQLQALIKIAPENTPKEIINPLNDLAKFAAKTVFTQEDYTAIHAAVENVLKAFSA